MASVKFSFNDDRHDRNHHHHDHHNNDEWKQHEERERQKAARAVSELRSQILSLIRELFDLNPTVALLPYERECCCNERGAFLSASYQQHQGKLGACISESQFQTIIQTINTHLAELHSTCCIASSAICGLCTLFIPLCMVMSDDSKQKTLIRQYLTSVNNGVIVESKVSTSTDAQTTPLLTSKPISTTTTSTSTISTTSSYLTTASTTTVVSTTSPAHWDLAPDELTAIMCRVYPQNEEQKWKTDTCDAEVHKLLGAYRDGSSGHSQMQIIALASAVGSAMAMISQIRSYRPQTITIVQQPVLLMAQAPMPQQTTLMQTPVVYLQSPPTTTTTATTTTATMTVTNNSASVTLSPSAPPPEYSPQIEGQQSSSKLDP
eukprot:TRINITY_DN2952_c0_g1_i1.p1 TRINITY_DN2952_c0_g1~~TRINITY_DN2952_c0_g1_i1.p1  ORF type:complete len:385 (+),score=93.73 TRINITY_DN2952_c0_g1_i1:25-1155(+)